RLDPGPPVRPPARRPAGPLVPGLRAGGVSVRAFALGARIPDRRGRSGPVELGSTRGAECGPTARPGRSIPGTILRSSPRGGPVAVDPAGGLRPGAPRTPRRGRDPASPRRPERAPGEE